MPHTCHWPKCPRIIPPRLFMCNPHWRQLPQSLRNAILATYRPGQERTKDPSPDYLQAAMDASAWALAQHTLEGLFRSEDA